MDISYALLVISKEINTALHEGVKELKYDKIKHVRDSVSNYNVLHKQLYGDGKTEHSTPNSMKKTFVPAHTKAPTPATKQLKQHFSKSPEMPRLKGKEPEPKSLEKLDKSNRGKRN